MLFPCPSTTNSPPFPRLHRPPSITTKAGGVSYPSSFAPNADSKKVFQISVPETDTVSANTVATTGHGLCCQCLAPCNCSTTRSFNLRGPRKGGSAQRVQPQTPAPGRLGILTLRGVCATRSFRRQRPPGLGRSRAPADTSRDAPSRKS